MGNADDMADPDAPVIPMERDCCPRCGASDAALSLLTSMTRYFVCRRCDYRWQVSATGEPSKGDGTARASRQIVG